MEHIKKGVEHARDKKLRRTVPTVSAVLDDGSLVETVYDATAHTTRFVVAENGSIRETAYIDLPDGRRLAPISGQNNLLTHGVVLLPSAPVDFGTKAELLASLQAFIHEYVDLTPLFERIAAHYIVLSWLYDSLHEMPYLRVRGEPGSGKTRFLLTIGSLCYKPIFASGASTVSPIFRMLDLVRGTLVFDEADFRFSDERAEVVKILNNGTTRGFPVLRVEQNQTTKEFNPTAFHVFGPKIVATRGAFEDRALESRFISEQMGGQRLRRDIPIAITDKHAARAQALRNQLLSFRLSSHGTGLAPLAAEPSVDPRVNQMFGPLLSVIDDEDTRRSVRALAVEYSAQTACDRGLDLDGQVLEAIHALMLAAGAPPSIHDLAETLARESRSPSSDVLTPRLVGQIVRRRLGLRTVRHREGHRIAPGESTRLAAQFDRLGLRPLPESHTPDTPRSPAQIDPRSVKVNDVNEVIVNGAAIGLPEGA
jgi:hypothetical protein